MNISLPEALKAFVDEQVADKERLRKLLLDGAAAPITGVADAAYFEGLRARVRQGEFD